MVEYRVIGRGGVGVINIQCSERNGKVVAVRSVYQDNEVIFMSRNGIVIRTKVSGISQIGRNTQGVRLMKLGGDDKVAAAAKIVVESEQELDKAIKKEETGEENGDSEVKVEEEIKEAEEAPAEEETQPEEKEQPAEEAEEKREEPEQAPKEVPEQTKDIPFAEPKKEEKADFNPKPTPSNIPSIDELRKKMNKRR